MLLKSRQEETRIEFGEDGGKEAGRNVKERLVRPREVFAEDP